MKKIFAFVSLLLLVSASAYSATQDFKGTSNTIRVIQLNIQNGTEAAHIKCTAASRYNGDANGTQDNIGKDAVTTGVWSLSAGGNALTLLSTGISGTLLGVLSSSAISNSSTTDVNVQPLVSSGNMVLYFTNSSTGANVDLAALVDTGDIYLHISYIATAP